MTDIPNQTLPEEEHELLIPPLPSATLLIMEVQRTLRNLGYVITGPVDGDITPKGNTEAAILDFRNKHNLPLTPNIDQELLDALATASARPVSLEQATATSTELAPKVTAVGQTRWTKFLSHLAAYSNFILAALLAVSDHLGEATEKLAPLKNFASELPGWVWLVGAGAVAVIIAASVHKTESALVQGYRKGTVLEDK